MFTLLAISKRRVLFGVWPFSNSACKIDNSNGEVLLLLRRANWALSIDGSCNGKVEGECEMKAYDLFSTKGETKFWWPVVGNNCCGWEVGVGIWGTTLKDFECCKIGCFGGWLSKLIESNDGNLTGVVTVGKGCDDVVAEAEVGVTLCENKSVEPCLIGETGAECGAGLVEIVGLCCCCCSGCVSLGPFNKADNGGKDLISLGPVDVVITLGSWGADCEIEGKFGLDIVIDIIES